MRCSGQPLGMSFTVQPEALRRVGNDMTTLADSVARAESFGDTYLRVEGTRGTQLVEIGKGINGFQWPAGQGLLTGRPCRVAYHGFGGAMHSLAHDYQTTDGAQAARYDRLMDEVDLNHVEAPQTLQAPTISLADHTEEFVEPPEGFPRLRRLQQHHRERRQAPRLSRRRKAPGEHRDTHADRVVKEQLQGDWKQIGRAVGALKALSRYWYKMEHTTRAVPNNSDGTWVGNRFHQQGEPGGQASWSGRAAAAATQHLYNLASARTQATTTSCSRTRQTRSR